LSISLQSDCLERPFAIVSTLQSTHHVNWRLFQSLALA